eukprot:786139-Pelagomonas_calceolata.AAC.4
MPAKHTVTCDSAKFLSLSYALVAALPCRISWTRAVRGGRPAMRFFARNSSSRAIWGQARHGAHDKARQVEKQRSRKARLTTQLDTKEFHTRGQEQLNNVAHNLKIKEK